LRWTRGASVLVPNASVSLGIARPRKCILHVWNLATVLCAAREAQPRPELTGEHPDIRADG